VNLAEEKSRVNMGKKGEKKLKKKLQFEENEVEYFSDSEIDALQAEEELRNSICRKFEIVFSQ
jgi:hypothetical protein